MLRLLSAEDVAAAHTAAFFLRGRDDLPPPARSRGDDLLMRISWDLPGGG